MGDAPTYALERKFDAPRELVWRTWTEPELIARWYGPNVTTIIHRLDLKPGGLWLIEMQTGGESHYQRAEYTEVTFPERLVWMHSNADKDWNIAPNVMMGDWPLALLATVTFEDDGERTAVRLTWTPHEASEAECASFAAAIDRVDRGWGMGMEKLAALLAEMQA